MDFIAGLIQGHEGLALQIVSILVISQSVLSMVSAGLDFIKDKTSTNVDNVAALWVGRIAGFAKSVVDFIQGNLQHK